MKRGSPIRSLDSAQCGELSALRSSSKFSPSVVCLIRMSSWLGFRVRVQGSGVLVSGLLSFRTCSTPSFRFMSSSELSAPWCRKVFGSSNLS